MKRKIVKELGFEYSLHGLLDGQSFDEAIANLAKAKEECCAKYPDAISIKLEVDDCCMVYIERWESDRELEKRKRQQKAKKSLLESKARESEAREKELLKQLQAKYRGQK